MITKTYGYIARVFGTSKPDIVNGHFEIPEKAWIVAELGQYPEVFFIDRERAEQFIGLINKTSPEDKTNWEGIIRWLFLPQWENIVKSFGGHEPEVKLYQWGSSLSDLKIKLRVMLDENGRQVRETDLTRHQEWTYAKSENEKSMIVTDSNFVDGRIYGKLKETDLSHPSWDELWGDKEQDRQPLSRREEIISRLVQKNSAVLIERMAEYEERIKQMTDEQIEKEYRMEFGE